MDAHDALNQILPLLHDDIVHCRLRVMQGRVDGSDGESYLLVCAGECFEDETIVQIPDNEYEAIRHLFPSNGSDLSEPVPMHQLSESLNA